MAGSEDAAETNDIAGVATVTDLSDTDIVIKFLLENKVQKTAIDEVIKRGYTSLEALRLVNMKDLNSPLIPLGQRRLILHVASSIAIASTEPNQPEVLVAAQQIDIMAPGPSVATQPNVISETPADPYSLTLLNTLLSQQQRLNSAVSTAPLGAPLDQSTTALNHPTSQPAAQPSWSDPQIHIATAFGKSVTNYLDICDYVVSNIEEELVIGSQGDQQILVKSGPRKPKLGSLTLCQWSIANMSILYKLSREGKLSGPSLMDYLSYTTKIYQLVQRYNLASVLLYDREYRKLQACEGFRWGTDVQHLHQINLQPREKTQAPGSQYQGPKKFQTPSPGNKNNGFRADKRDVGICRNFSSPKGCTFPQCKYKHQCILPGCTQKHSAVSHTLEKN